MVELGRFCLTEAEEVVEEVQKREKKFVVEIDQVMMEDVVERNSVYSKTNWTVDLYRVSAAVCQVLEQVLH